MTTIFKATNIKRYFQDSKTEFHAVNGISFSVNAGEIISFVGPNGAGKTTLLKTISNYLAPTAGNIQIMGIDLTKHPKKARQKLGVVFGGERGFYNNATVIDNLEFFARLLNVKEKDIKSNVTEALKIVNLSDYANKKVETLSKGMLQRLHIARGIINQPVVLMLDEPTVGLDIESVLAIRNLIKDLSNKGCGIILTSHNMTDIEELASQIKLIRNGKIQFSGSLDEIKSYAHVSKNASLAKAYLAVVDQLKRK